jgi:hypothetical protein
MERNIKIILGISALIVIGVIAGVFWKNLTVTVTEPEITVPQKTEVGPEGAVPKTEEAPSELKTEETVFPRKNISTYLGIWLPAILHPGAHSMNKREDLIAIGANTVGIGIEVNYYPENGKFDEKMLSYAKQKARDFIRYYKEGGLAVMVSLVPIPVKLQGEPGPIPENIKEEVLKNYEKIVVDLAKIAEEENAEIFCPMDEPDYKLGAKRGSSWGQEILPKIKSVYSGKVLWKGSLSRPFEKNQRIDFSGYDIAGFTVFPWGGLTLYPQNVEFYINKLNQWAGEDGVKERIVAEFGNYQITKITKEEEPEALQIVFEKGRGKLNGFILLDPPSGWGTSIKDSELEPVIKSWFEKLK